MKNILFVRRKGVYLPEISAYINYVKHSFPRTTAYDSSCLSEPFSERDFEVVWKFMGFDTTLKSSALLIHEYGSSSVGRFPKIKNFVKRKLNITPDFRVFLNQTVCKEMGFRDSTPYRFRDMGVGDSFFKEKNTKNAGFDFVYSGSLDRGIIIHRMLDHFKSKMRDSTLLVIGDAPNDIHQKFGNTPNIHFTGKMKYEEVATLLTQARYGLNIMPDVYPFNIQTSTKVLEYCAAQLPVITTDYRWIREFEKKNSGNFFYIDPSFESLSLKKVDQHPFIVPCVEGYKWGNIIRESGVFDFIHQLETQSH